MPPSPNTFNIDYVFKLLLFLISSLLVLGALMFTASQFFNIVVLLSIAMVFSYILLLPVAWTEHLIIFLSDKCHHHAGFHKLASRTPDVKPRVLAVFIVLFSACILIVYASITLLPSLSHQLEGFARALPKYVVQVEETLLEWSDQALGAETLRQIFDPEILEAQENGVVRPPMQEGAPISVEEKQVMQASFMQSTLNQTVQLLENVTSTLLNNVMGVITHTVTSMLYFLTGLVLMFYFLLDGEKLRHGFLRMLPLPAKRHAHYLMDSFHRVMLTFVKGQVILAIISGGLMFILYSLFQVKYAVFLSAFFTVAEILPVIGPWIAFTPGILVMLFSERPETAFYVWGLYVLIKDNFLLPKVVGDVMGLHPVVVIFALFVCAKAGGVAGVVMAIPLASILHVIVRYTFNPPLLPESESDPTTPSQHPANG